MKKIAKLLAIVFVIVAISALSFGLVACNNDNDNNTLRFSAPQGTPALAILRLKEDNPTIGGFNIQYDVVSPSQIDLEMSTDKSDLVIMPVTGADLVRNGKDYKLVSVAVEGSLFMVGHKDGGNTLTMDDIKGKKIACIGKNAVPGLVFRYVMEHNNIEIIENGTPNENQVLVKFVGAAPNAMSSMSSREVDFAVVGEPAATQFKNAPALSEIGVNAEMDMQLEYSRVNPTENGESYPQAGLFVRTSLANNVQFMNSLFDALSKSKEWVIAHPADVQTYANQNLYEGAVFPAPSIPRCAIKCEVLDDTAKNEIIAFLKNIKPVDTNNQTIDWDAAKTKIFG